MNTPSPAAGTEPDVGGLRRELEAFLTHIGDHSASRWLGPGPSAAPARAKIVVVGEVGAGKTSLINALLGRGDLLPTGAITTGSSTTATYVAIGADTAEGIRAFVDDGHALTDELTHIDRYVCAGGDRSAEVAQAEVRLHDPRLQDLTLFDTPGIGGLNRADTRLTLQALENATALVFVCSARAKISLSERDFLVEASHRIDRVVFVLTQTDRYTDWRHTLAENEQTVREDRTRFPADRFVDVAFVPVSAHKALAALAGNSAGLRQRSGIDELWTHLHAIAATHTHLAQLNELQAIKSALRDAYRTMGERQRAVADPAASDALATLTQQIATLNEQDLVWRKNLGREVLAARGQVLKQLRRSVRQLNTDYDVKLNNVSVKQIRGIEDGVVGDLCALQQQAVNDVRDHAIEIGRRMLLGVPHAEAAVAELDAALPDPADTPSEYLSTRPAPPNNPAAALMGVQTSFFGFNMAKGMLPLVLGGIGVTIPVVGPVATLFALPVGLGWYKLQKRSREHAENLAGLRAWTTNSIQAAHIEIDGYINSAFTDVAHLMQDTIEQSFKDAAKAAADAKSIHQRSIAEIEDEKKRIAQLRDQLIPMNQTCEKYRIELLGLTQAQAAASELPAT